MTAKNMFRFTIAVVLVAVFASDDVRATPAVAHYDDVPSPQPPNMNRALNDECLYDTDCRMQNVFCDKPNKKCICKMGFRLNAQRNDCIATTAAACLRNEDCSSLANSQCLNQVCSCKDDYVPHPEKSQCLPRVTLGQHCDVAEQCHTRFNFNAHCIQEVCVCRENHHISPNNSCIISKTFGQQCEESYECYFGEEAKDRTRCFENRCVCKEEWQETEDQKCGSGASGLKVWSSVLTLAVMGSISKIISI